MKTLQHLLLIVAFSTPFSTFAYESKNQVFIHKVQIHPCGGIDPAFTGSMCVFLHLKNVTLSNTSCWGGAGYGVIAELDEKKWGDSVFSLALSAKISNRPINIGINNDCSIRSGHPLIRNIELE